MFPFPDLQQSIAGFSERLEGGAGKDKFCVPVVSKAIYKFIECSSSSCWGGGAKAFTLYNP